MKKFLIISFVSLAFFLTGCVPQKNLGGLTGLTGTPAPGMTQCFFVEENVFFNLTRLEYKPGISVRYKRVFANAMIPAYKIGTTTKKIKDIGQEPLPQNEIHQYTEAGNWQRKPMDPFLLVRLQEQATPLAQSLEGQVAFDIYVDEEIIKTNSLPDFVKNCEYRGGRSIVVIPPAGTAQLEMPNGFFPKDQIVSTGFEVNYAAVSADLKNWYIKIDSVPQIAQGAIQIGRISMTSTSQTGTYEVFFHLGAIYLVNGNQVFQYDGTDDLPQMTGSKAKTLKLETFRFVVLSVWNWYTPECKPVIYFYPEKPTNLSLWVYPRGYLTKTEPEYKNGWLNLRLNPTGQIFYQGNLYPYLHYEAMIGDFVPPKTGFMVRRENLPTFFDEILPKLGLNQKEAEDFKNYWLSGLKDSPYFQISLLSPKEIEAIEPIKFSQNPETFIRVRFYFKGLKVPIKIDPPKIANPPKRSGFTAVEWGGLYDE